MQGRDNHFPVFVLKIGQQILQMMAVMVVDQRNAAGNLARPHLLPVLDQVRPNHIGDGQRPIVIACLSRHLIEFPRKVARQ